MAECSGQGGESHNENTGSDCRFQFVAQNGCQDQKHHHSASGTDKATDASDDSSADDGLDDPFFGIGGSHRFFGCHNGFYDEFNTE